MMMRLSLKKSWRKQRGFTLIELMIAMLVMLVGLVAVAQLVPAAIRLNSANRYDSTALVIAQRQMEAMLNQPLTANAFTDPQGLLCPVGNNCNLGNPANPNQVLGSPVVWPNNRPLIDFTAGQVANYNFTFTDPNDPSGVSYDVRWAVITFVNAATPTGKRFIVGVRRRGGNAPLQAVTVDSMLEK